MTKIFGMLLSAALVMSGAANAAVVNVNVASGNGGNANQTLNGTAYVAGSAVIPYTGTAWNDVGATLGGALVDSDGIASTVTITRTSDGGNGGAGFTFSQTDGILVGAADILDNYLAAHNGTFGGTLNGPLTFDISGLDDAALHDIHIVSVGDTIGQGGSFTIGGSTLNTSGASPDGPLGAGDNFVSFTGLSSTGGTISLSMAAGPGNASFAALSGIQIQSQAVPEPSSMALLMLAGVVGVARRRRK